MVRAAQYTCVASVDMNVAVNDGLVPNVIALRSAADEAGKVQILNSERMLVFRQ